jgi:hypothetical protein
MLMKVLFQVEVSKSAIDRWIDEIAQALPSEEEMVKILHREKPVTSGHLDELFPSGSSACVLALKDEHGRILLTQEVEKRLAELERQGRMKEMPPILAMQSAIDATVVVPKLITVLFDRIKPGGPSELVLFDVNHVAWLDNLVNLSFEREIRPRLQRKDLPFKLTLIVNAASNSLAVKAQTRSGDSLTEQALNEAWPKDVFSLSHVAVPIPPTDPVYGTSEATVKSGLPLGSLSMRGEHGALMISDSMLIRQRHNPFSQPRLTAIRCWSRRLRPSPTTRPFTSNCRTILKRIWCRYRIT